MSKETKEFNIEHKDLCSTASKSTGMSEKEIDTAVVGYEDAITNTVKQVFTDNPNIENVNVHSRISGFEFNRDDEGAISAVHLMRRDMFKSINEEYYKNKSNNENENKEAAAS